jgi:hypothetical protein
MNTSFLCPTEVLVDRNQYFLAQIYRMAKSLDCKRIGDNHLRKDYLKNRIKQEHKIEMQNIANYVLKSVYVTSP